MYIELNGTRIAVDEYHADGEDVLLLVHGLGGTANFWAPVVAAYAPSHRVIVPELPGAGRSVSESACSFDSLARTLLSLLDALNIERAHVVGHSMGSIVCQHLAAIAPARVQDLVLLGPLAELPEAARAALAARAATARDEGMESIAAAVCERGLAAETKARQPVVVGFVREMMLRQPPAGYAAHCLALATGHRAPADAVRCRTLLLSGTEDTTATPASVAALAASLPATQVEMIPDCGHWTAVEQPLPVVDAMQRFHREARG